MIYSCHSYYSLLFGTMKVETVAEHAQKFGIDTLLLADINNTSGCFDFLSNCLEQHIKPVFGMECRNGDTWLYTCIARNMEGFYEINKFLSECNLQERSLPQVAPEFSNVYVIYPIDRIQWKNGEMTDSTKTGGHKSKTAVKSWNKLRDNEYIAVRPQEVNRIYVNGYNRYKEKLVAFSPVSFGEPDEYELHMHLRAIHHNTLLSMLTPKQIAKPEEYFVAPDLLRIAYDDVKDCLRNAEKLLHSCCVNFDFETPKVKQIFTTSRYDDRQLLEKLAMDGMVYRYGKNNKIAQKRLKQELEVIDKLGFSGYFLIAWDIIRYSMSRGIYHVGRGSGGNSIVAYCLKITDIDPIELNLYFERFINPQRSSPPDFDIDYSWKDRDDIYDYIFKRHGREYTALLGTINTFKQSSAIRELGKVYGLPKNDIDTLVDKPDTPYLKNDITEKILKLSTQLAEFPHHRSIHAGGVMISQEKIYYYTALDLPPKNFPTTQWDMYLAEKIRFDKLDILSQRGLGHIKECTDIVLKNRGVNIDIHQVEAFKNNPDLNQRLYNGEAIGCFYIESPAMRGLLKKLRCNNYTSLVAASSIIRPGVAQSGMMKEYIKRFHNQDDINYLHPIFKEQLKETFGVMVYQEDVIKICHHFAGLTLADADILRRGMSGKYRSKKEFERISAGFFSNCRERGYPETLINEVWRQISSFAGYAFCKAHSASYAVESYQSLYLKTYFPHEFHVAVINNFGGYYHTWVYINEARKHGAQINLPDINKSEYKTCIYRDKIYLGFIHLKGLEDKLINRILEERQTGGEYKSLQDFTQRVPVGIEQLNLLIKSGALRFTGKTKKELMWERLLYENTIKQVRHNALFYEPEMEIKLPPLKNEPLEDAYDELEVFGFPISMSRFDMLKTDYRGNTDASTLLASKGKTVRMVGDLVTIKPVQTVRNERMNMGCFIDMKGDFFDTVHFPDSLRQYPFTGQGVYLLEGKVTEEFDYPSLEVKKMARLPYKTPDPDEK